MGGVLIYFTFREAKMNQTLFLLGIMITLFKLSGIRDDYFFFFLVFMIMFLSSNYVRIGGGRQLIATIDKYSYNIYLVHPLVLYFLKEYQYYVQIIVGLLWTFLFAWLSYKCIDEGIGKKLKKLLRV